MLCDLQNQFKAGRTFKALPGVTEGWGQKGVPDPFGGHAFLALVKVWR